MINKLENICNEIFNEYKLKKLKYVKSIILNSYDKLSDSFDDGYTYLNNQLTYEIIDLFFSDKQGFFVGNKETQNNSCDVIQIDGVDYVQKDNMIVEYYINFENEKKNAFLVNDNLFLLDNEQVNSMQPWFEDILLNLKPEFIKNNIRYNKVFLVSGTYKNYNSYFDVQKSIEQKQNSSQMFECVDNFELGALLLPSQQLKEYYNVLKKYKFNMDNIKNIPNLRKAFKEYKTELVNFSIEKMYEDVTDLNFEVFKTFMLSLGEDLNDIIRIHLTSLATYGLFKNYEKLMCMDYSVISLGYFKIVENVFYSLLKKYWQNFKIYNNKGEIIPLEKLSLGQMAQIYYNYDEESKKHFKLNGCDTSKVLDTLNDFRETTRNGFVHKDIMNEFSFYETAKKETAKIVVMLFNTLTK